MRLRNNFIYNIIKNIFRITIKMLVLYFVLIVILNMLLPILKFFYPLEVNIIKYFKYLYLLIIFFSISIIIFFSATLSSSSYSNTNNNVIFSPSFPHISNSNFVWPLPRNHKNKFIFWKKVITYCLCFVIT